MTYGIKEFVGLWAYRSGDKRPRSGFFGTVNPIFGSNWADWKLFRLPGSQEYWTAADLCTYTYGAHAGHLLDFGVALLCYWYFYWDGSWLEEARTIQVGWIARVLFFNLCCGLLTYSCWHYCIYVSPLLIELSDDGVKYNPSNPYEPDGTPAKLFTSSSGQIEREITFSTLGWLQSALWQCLLTHLWARGLLPFYTDFWAYPLYSLTLLWLVAYLREIHFYWVHRAIHPWKDRELGPLDGDVGAFLYRHVHSLHHKSYNPGPWSGLCMHPVEHLIYYSCAWLPPLLVSVHPLHFLYCKFHADIAPIGGHDGMDPPGGKGDHHYLHHAKFECNYGGPFPINFDKWFGTWADWEVYKTTGTLGDLSAWAQGQVEEAVQEERHHQQQQMEPGNNKSVEVTSNDRRIFTWEEVAAHNRKEDCYVALYGQVLDITNFLQKHPGGPAVLLSVSGKDGTSAFETVHGRSGGYSLVEKWLPTTSVLGEVAGWHGPKPPTRRAVEGPKLWREGPGIFLMLPLLALSSWLSLYR